MKGGQFGHGNGYSNRTLFLFSHLEFPAEWPAGWRKRRCKGEVRSMESVLARLGCVTSGWSVCMLSAAYAGEWYFTYKKDNLFADSKLQQKWPLKWTEQASRWWTRCSEQMRRALDCRGALWPCECPFPSLDLTTFICERRGLDKTFSQPLPWYSSG